MKNFIPLNFKRISTEEMLLNSEDFLNMIKKRRTVREFSNKEVDEKIIENCVRSASYAPSGANKQPWHFVIVKDPDIKKQIRTEAEKEEREFYNGRATEEWLADLEQFDTNESKPFLEVAPYLIAIFEEKYSIDSKEETRFRNKQSVFVKNTSSKHTTGIRKHKNYYVKESVGIATGVLITALHYSGLVTLTHTPSPMNFLNKILNRPENEKPFLLLVVGYPKEGTLVPAITKKSFNDIATIL